MILLKRNQWFKHLLLVSPPWAECQKCQGCEVWHSITLHKMLESGTELEMKSFVLGLIHAFPFFHFPCAVAGGFWNITPIPRPVLAGECTCLHRHIYVSPTISASPTHSIFPLCVWIECSDGCLMRLLPRQISSGPCLSRERVWWGPQFL